MHLQRLRDSLLTIAPNWDAFLVEVSYIGSSMATTLHNSRRAKPPQLVTSEKGLYPFRYRYLQLCGLYSRANLYPE